MPDTAQIVIVTGAAGNLGRATLALLTQRGASVVAVDHGAAALDAFLKTLPDAGRHLPLAGVDLADPAACERVVAAAIERFGRVDGLVNTVGGFAAAPIADSDAIHWERMFRVNVTTTLNLFRAAVTPMRRQKSGSLIAIGAGAALRAPAGLAAYAAAKSAVLRLVESLADELKPDGIRVNAVLPGTIDTPQNRAAMPGVDPTAWVKPQQVAEVIAFLLGEASSGITGTLVPVTGFS